MKLDVLETKPKRGRGFFDLMETAALQERA
jgi:hypothetical protein